VITITGFGDHDPPDWMITIDRNPWSRSAGFRDHNRPERAGRRSAAGSAHSARHRQVVGAVGAGQSLEKAASVCGFAV